MQDQARHRRDEPAPRYVGVAPVHPDNRLIATRGAPWHVVNVSRVTPPLTLSSLPAMPVNAAPPTRWFG